MSARIETLFGKDESGATYTFLPRTSTKAVMDESGNTADELITDLSQEVSELINDVGELSGKVETLSGEVVTQGEKLSELENIIGIDTNYIEGHLITANGSIVENAAYSYSEKIPVNADILSKGLKWNYGTYISNAFLVLLSGDSVVDNFSMTSNSNFRKLTASQLETAIASNATDVIISFETANGGSLYTIVDNVELYKSGKREGLIKDVVSIKEKIEIIDTKVNTNITTDRIEDGAVTIDKIEFTSKSKNLINVNDADFIFGAYLPSLNSNPKYNSTGYIKVEYGKTFCFSDKGNIKTCRFVYGYAEIGETYIKQIGENISTFTIDDETINYVRISYFSTFKYPMLEEGENPTEYEEYSILIDEKYLPKTEDYTWLFKAPELVFPSVVYALKGHENSIYHKNYMNFVNPYLWAIQSTKSNSHWKYRERCFRINPSDTAVSRLRVYLYNKITLEEKFFKDIPTNLVEIALSPVLTRVNVIGDSFTYNGMWYRQIQDKLNNIKLVGMRKSYKCDDDMRGEGRGGWELDNYATASYDDLAINHMQSFSPFLQVEGYTYYGPIQFWDAVVNGTSKYPNLYTYGTSGFQDYINWFDANGYKNEPNINDLMYDGNLGKYVSWNGSEWIETNIQKTDFEWNYAKYISTWNITEPDIVMILLGTNDFLNGYSGFDKWKSQMDGLITSIKTYKSTMKIGICTAFVTTEAANSSDAVNGFISTRNEWEARKLVIESYDTEENKDNNIYVVDTGVVVDPDYGFSMQEQKPFADYEGNAVEYYGSNGVHCGDGGYKQLGTCAAAFVEYIRSLE